MEEQQARMNIAAPMRDLTTNFPSITPAVQSLAEELEHRPESSYSYEDWNVRAFAAHGSGKLDDAVHFWGKAAEVPAAGAENAAQALYNKGVSLARLDRTEEAIGAYDTLITEYGQDPEPKLRAQVAKAMGNRGVMLGQLKRDDDAIAAFETLITVFGQDPAPALRHQVAQAMFNKGVTLGRLGRTDEAVAEFDAVIAKYGQDPVSEIRESVAKSMFGKGTILGDLKRGDDAISIYDALITRYAQDPDSRLRQQVAMSMLNRAVMLKRLKRNDKAIAAVDALISEHGQETAPERRELVARAMNTKAAALRELNREDEAIVVYHAVIILHGAEPSGPLRDVVGNAKNGKGYTLLCSAKAKWTNVATRNDLLAQAARLFAESLTSRPMSGVALGNQAYCAWLQGNGSDADKKFSSALSMPDGGRQLFEATLEDLTIHSVPEDAGFRVLIERLWDARREYLRMPSEIQPAKAV
jgi:tetratricopeptide (TPR) repeat protein